MVALVTGAGGFLGSAIGRRLAEEGLDVVPVGRPEIQIPSPAFDRVVGDARPDLVVHCAAPASVQASISDPATDYAGSVEVLAAVLDRVRLMSVPAKVLLVSSAAVYGNPEVLPVGEEHRLAPISPYGSHREACERLLAEVQSNFGVGTATMRVFSAYGPGLRRQLLWDATRRGLETGKIELGGTGRESRDFIHVEDVAAATAALTARAPFEGEAVNVASGAETRIDRIATLIAEAIGLDSAAVVFDGRSRFGDPINWLADISRLRGLGFEPSWSIEAGVADYVDWVRRLVT